MTWVSPGVPGTKYHCSDWGKGVVFAGKSDTSLGPQAWQLANIRMGQPLRGPVSSRRLLGSKGAYRCCWHWRNASSKPLILALKTTPQSRLHAFTVHLPSRQYNLYNLLERERVCTCHHCCAQAVPPLDLVSWGGYLVFAPPGVKTFFEQDHFY